MTHSMKFGWLTLSMSPSPDEDGEQPSRFVSELGRRPVHRIGPAWQPRQTEPTFLVVFRDVQQEVQFTEINAVTAHVLALLDSGLTGQQAFAQLAQEMAHPDPEALQGFGEQLLNSLREQGVLLGTLK